MAGARDRYANEGELALTALNAGVDVLLDLQDPGAVIDHLTGCVEGGTLDAATIDAAYERVQALKRRIFGTSHGSGTQLRGVMSPAELGWQVARGAIKVSGDAGLRLPFAATEPITAILLKPYETHLEPPEQPLADALRRRFNAVHYIQLGPNVDAGAYESAAALASKSKQLLVAMIVRPAAWHSFGLRPEQAKLLKRVLSQRKDAVIASLGVPYVLEDYPEAAVRICTFSDVPVSQEALADFLVNGGRS
jgi:beta-glucosidase-like glycosyl hydrolase